MSNPYTYCLIIKLFNWKYYYYGVRSANKVEPEKDLWNKYFSSSKLVEALIAQYGKDSFEYRIMKIFNTAEEAHLHESKFLVRVNAMKRENWLNQANYPDDFYGGMKGKQHTLESIEKMREAHRGKHFTNEHKEKLRSSQLGKYDGEKHPMWGKHHTLEAKNAQSIAMSGENHYNFGKYFTEEEKIQCAKEQGFSGCWLEHTDGRQKYIKNQSAFAKEFDLNQGHLNKVINGKVKSCKGWKHIIKGEN